MKKYFRQCVWIVFSFLIVIACQTKKEEVSAIEQTPEKIEAEVFVANPQDIEERDVSVLPINTAAPDFNLPGTDGRFYTLKSFEKADVLVIIFTCNHCPTAQAYEDRMIQLTNDYKDENVQVVAISPNSVKTLLFEELGYSDMGDTYEEMKIRVKDKQFNFPYLYDGDTQETSIKYGPVATPHAFVFNKERKLKYNGRLDDSEKPGTANAEDLRAAIDAVLLNAEILDPVKKTFGCSVKWGWKSSWTDKVNRDWKEKPVSLEEINEEGLKILMKNDSEKLWLINVWATWCGPCVIEYPEFVDIHRMYMGRDFEFISLCADKLDQKEKALKFLKSKNSAVKNYIFSGADIYQLISIVDPDWDGALPYTVLIEPDGKIVYKNMGPIDPLELKKIIVDHPMIGRYY
jgi:peroxiredoxin